MGRSWPAANEIDNNDSDNLASMICYRIPLRRSELVLIVYFLYASVVSMALPVARSITFVTIALNAGVIGAFLLLAWADSAGRGRITGIVRDWYALALALLTYREMGWFALPHANTALEQSWVGWDRMLLNGWGVKAAIESLGPLLPAILEISYSLVYAIAPFCLAMLYGSARRERVDAFLFTFLLAVTGCYVLFPYFPSEPPRTVFPTEDLPAYLTPFRRFNLGLLGGYGIHTSVFPSAHNAGAFSASLAMLRLLPERPWVGRGLLALAVSIGTATVYGRYHYLVDALAGLGMALAAEAVSRFFSPKIFSPRKL